MPSKSKAQHNLMAMVAHDPKAAKRLGIPQSVGKEYVAADKGKKFSAGGRPDLQKINRPKTDHGRLAILKEGGEMKESKTMMKKEIGFMKAKGAPKSMIKHEESEMKGMKKGGKAYAKGGSVSASAMGKVVSGGKRPHGEHTVQQKGHTRGKMVTMKKGGKC